MDPIFNFSLSPPPGVDGVAGVCDACAACVGAAAKFGMWSLGFDCEELGPGVFEDGVPGLGFGCLNVTRIGAAGASSLLRFVDVVEYLEGWRDVRALFVRKK